MSSHWNLYWKDSCTGSFGAIEPKWYKQNIIPLWQHVFSTLPHHGRILDLATGNGAVTNIAAEYAKNHSCNWRIEGVDAAKIQAVNNVTLLSPCPLEKLTLHPDSYDLITSQFGIEYSRISQSLPNISCGLKPGCTLIIIAHHTDSVLCANSRNEIDQYRHCLQQQPIFSRLEKLILAMGEIRSTTDLKKVRDPASSARQSLNQAVSTLTTRFPQGIVIAELLKNIQPLFNAGIYWPIETKMKYTDHLQQQMKLARKRLTDQLAAALTRKDIDTWRTLAISHGLTLTRQKILRADEQNIIAWHLQFNKE